MHLPRMDAHCVVGVAVVGNGWAAAGMLRVLGTMQNSQFASSFKNEMKDLTSWVLDIQKAMYANIVRPCLFLPHPPSSSYVSRHLPSCADSMWMHARKQQSNNLFLNYADSNSSSNFADAASTALLASTVYRLSLLTNTHTYLPHAEACRSALLATSTSSSSSTTSSSSTSTSASASATVTAFSNAAHFSTDGWLTPVVNPDAYGSEGSQSPESQAFVLQMQAAWQDWVDGGSVGANGAGRMVTGGPGGGLVLAVIGVWMLVGL